MIGKHRMLRAALGTAALWGVISGCSSVFTYNQAMELRSSYYDFHFEPPDSEAFALPPAPPVYAVVFKEGFYVPPGPVVIPARASRARKDTVATATAVDTVAAPILLPPPPQVQVDLTPSQEADLIANARRDIGRADSLLASVAAGRSRDRTTMEQVEAARGLLRQAEAALARKDYQGAANLGQKARLLAETLSAGRP
jgi:hypothetical protein